MPGINTILPVGWPAIRPSIRFATQITQDERDVGRRWPAIRSHVGRRMVEVCGFEYSFALRSYGAQADPGFAQSSYAGQAKAD